MKKNNKNISNHIIWELYNKLKNLLSIYDCDLNIIIQIRNYVKEKLTNVFDNY